MFPCFTATILSLNFANISTSEPVSDTDGARINTPLKEEIPTGSMEMFASKESFWRPKEFLSIFTSRTSKRGCSTLPTTLSLEFFDRNINNIPDDITSILIKHNFEKKSNSYYYKEKINICNQKSVLNITNKLCVELAMIK